MRVYPRGSEACSGIFAIVCRKPCSVVGSDEGHSAGMTLVSGSVRITGSIVISTPVAVLVVAVVEILLVRFG